MRVVPGTFVKGRGIALANMLLVRQLLVAERPNVLLTYNFGAIEGALVHRLWPRCRHLHFEDGFGPDEATGRQLPRRVWLRRLALSGRSRIVVPSRVLERVARRQWRFAEARVTYLPNGVDVDRFSPDVDRCLSPAAGLTIGTVGVLRPEKNIARLVEAVASLPETVVAKLIIAGDGPERPRLRALAERLGIAGRVDLVGHEDCPEHRLRQFDLFALSSDTEQMPLSLLEAMATALPVVATDVGDIRAMLPPAQHPFLVPATDADGLATAITSLARNRALCWQLGNANRTHACAHFSEEVMIRGYARLLAPADNLGAMALSSVG